MKAQRHKMREWLSGGVSPCQGEGRGFESRLALNNKEGIFDRRFLLCYSVSRSDSYSHRVNLGRMRMEAHTPTFTFFLWLCGVHFTEQRHCEESRVRMSPLRSGPCRTEVHWTSCTVSRLKRKGLMRSIGSFLFLCLDQIQTQPNRILGRTRMEAKNMINRLLEDGYE